MHDRRSSLVHTDLEGCHILLFSFSFSTFGGRLLFSSSLLTLKFHFDLSCLSFRCPLYLLPRIRTWTSFNLNPEADLFGLRSSSFLFVSHFLLLFFDMCFVNLYIRIASFVLVPTPMVGLHLEFSSLLKSLDWSRRDGQPFYFSNVQWAARSHDHCSWKCSFHVMRFRVGEVWSSNLSPTLR